MLKFGTYSKFTSQRILGGNLYDLTRRKGIFTFRRNKIYIYMNSENHEENGYGLKLHLLVLY